MSSALYASGIGRSNETLAPMACAESRMSPFSLNPVRMLTTKQDATANNMIKLPA